MVLVFYKSTCPICQLSLPFVQQLKTRVWGVSQDDLKESVGFAKHMGLGFPILVDDHPYPVSSAYGLEYVPGFFIVGTDGKIELSDYGFSKDALNTMAGLAGPVPLFAADDKLPARKPG